MHFSTQLNIFQNESSAIQAHLLRRKADERILCLITEFAIIALSGLQFINCFIISNLCQI